MFTWMKDAFHSPAVLTRPVCPARQKCFLSSLLHIVFLLKSYHFIVLGIKREQQNKKSLGCPGANYTLGSSKMAPGAKDITNSERL